MKGKHISSVARRIFFGLLFVALLLFSAHPPFAVAAGVPTIVSYQGRLANSSGDLLGGTGTPYFFKFSIFDNPTVGSGSRVWPLTGPGTTTALVRQGIFSVDIGDVAAGYPDVLNYDFNTNKDIYLQVEVSADGSSFQTLSPRQRIASAPFAALAAAVSGSTTPSSFGTTTPLGTSQVTVAATSSASTGITVIGAVAQTADLLQVLSASSTPLLTVTAEGALNVASSATSTFANGIDLSDGCFSVNGVCLTGTGHNTYTVGDILYADTSTSLARLPIGANGTVLKVSGGVPVWGIAASGGGTGSLFSTTTDELAIVQVDPTQVFVLGASATSTDGLIFEVSGNTKLGGDLTVTGTSTTQNLIATTASTTDLTTGTLSITGSGTSTFANGINLTAGCFAINNVCVGNGGPGSFTSLLVTGSTTLQNFTFTNATGTNATTTNLFTTTLTASNSSTTNATSTTLFAVTGAFTNLTATNFTPTNIAVSGLFQASSTALFGQGLTAFASSTFQDITFRNATGTNATTSTFFASSLAGSTASTTNLTTGTLAVVGSGTSTFSNGINLTAGCFAINNVCVGNGGPGSFTSLLVTGSTTLQNFTFTNATGTNATTTNLFTTNFYAGNSTTTNIEVTNNLIVAGLTTFTDFTSSGLGTLVNLLATGSTTLQNFTFLNATGTNATTTNFAVTGLSQLGTVIAGVWQGTEIGATFGGTGQTSYAVGDILYADTPTSLARLAVGANGTVLKVSGGLPAWGVDLTSGGGAGTSPFSTTTDNLAIIENDPSQVVIIGSTATTSEGLILEVSGNTKLGGTLLVTGSTTLQNFTFVNGTGTSATTTNFFATNLVATNGVFTNLTALNFNPESIDTAYGTTTNATSTNLAVSNSLNVSGTTTLSSLFVTGSTTLQNFIAQAATTTSLAVTGNSTSTFANGINLTAGCFAINNVCISGSGASSGTAFDFIQATNFGSLALRPSTTIALWASNGFFASSTSRFEGLATFDSGILARASSTFQNFTGVNGTTTNFAVTGVASTTALTTGTLSITGSGTSTFANGINLTAGCFAINNVCVGNGGPGSFTSLTVSGLSTLTNLLLTGSTTLQNLTFVNGTGTSATTTNFFVTNLVSNNSSTTNATTTNLASALFNNTGLATIGTLLVNGSTTLQDLTFRNATGSNATTSTFFASSLTGTTASTTNLTTGTLAVVGSGTSTFSNGIDISAGCFAIAGNCIVSASGAGSFTTLSVSGLTALSDLLLSGSTTLQNFTFTNATGTNATSTNLFTSILNASTASTTNLTAGALSVTGLTSLTTFTSSGLGTLANLLVTGSSTLQDFTGVNGTTTNFTVTGVASTTVLNTGSLAVTGNSTSTFANGINLTAGCFAINNVCISGSGASSGTAFDFIQATNFGSLALRPSTTIALWASNGFFASSTSRFEGLATFDSGILARASSTFQNFTGVNATTTNATTTNFFATNFTASNFTITGTTSFSSLFTTGSTTLQNLTFVNGTGSAATTSNFFSSTLTANSASTTNLTTGTLAVVGSGTSTFSNGINLTAGCFAINNVCVGTGAGNFTSLTVSGLFQASSTALFGQGLTAFASSTLQNFTGVNGTTTNFFATNLFGTTGNLATLLVTGSTTLQGFTASNSTTTNATTTNLAVTGVASTTALNTGRLTVTGNSTSTFANGINLTAGCFAINNVCVGNGGPGSFTSLLVTGSTTLQNFTFVNATGTNATTTNLFTSSLTASNSSTTNATSTTLFAVTGAFTNLTATNFTPTNITVSGLFQASSTALFGQGLTAFASSTFQDITFRNATGTNATTSAFFASSLTGSTASTTNLTTGTLAVVGSGTSTFSNGINLTAGCFAINNVCVGNGGAGSFTTLTASGLTTLTNLFLTGSTTLQNFTFVNATGTSATTTNLFASIFNASAASTTNLTSGALSVTGLTNLATFTSSGLGTLANLLVSGSSTLQNFTGLNSTTTNATSTTLAVTGVASTTALNTGRLTVTGNSTSTFANGINLTAGCFAINNVCISGSGASSGAAFDFIQATNFGALALRPSTTIALWASNGFFASSTSRFQGLATFDSGILTSASSTLQNFTFLNATGTNATTTNFFASNFTTLNFSAGTTSLTRLLVTGSTTLQGFTFLSATGTNATTTNLAVTGSASTTRLTAEAFFQSGFGTCSSGASVTYDSATGKFGCANTGSAAYYFVDNDATKTATADNDTTNVWSPAVFPNVTASSTDSSILVAVNLQITAAAADDERNVFRVVRAIGANPSCSTSPAVGTTFDGAFTTNAGEATSAHVVFLDSPATTSNVRYTICTSNLSSGTVNNTVASSTVTLVVIPSAVASSGVVGVGTINAGTAGHLAFYSSSGTDLTQTSSGLIWDDLNGRLGIGGTSTPSATLSVAGSVAIAGTGADAVSITSGTGGITFAVDGTGTSGNIQIGAGGGTATPDLLVLDDKNTASDPTGTNGAMYYNSNAGKFRCFQNGGWRDCVSNPSAASVNDTSITSPTPGTNPTFGTEIEILTPTNPSITPKDTTQRILITGAVQVVNPTGGDDTDASTVVRVRRGSGSCAGTQVGTDFTTSISDPIQTYWIPFSLIDSPGTASSQTYTVCAAMRDGNGATATNATIGDVMITISEVAATGADLAEIYYTKDPSLAAGDVVTFDSSIEAGVMKSSRPYDSRVLGVISTIPGVLLGDRITDSSSVNIPTMLALAGRVPVRVTTENGPIKVGDYLTSSSIPGVAMKATKAGPTIGQAITAYDRDGVGTVTVFVKNGSFSGDEFAAVTRDISSTSLDSGKTILGELISRGPSGPETNAALSYIGTDRLVAGVDVVTPRLIAQTVFTDGIESLSGGDISLLLNTANASSSLVVRSSSGASSSPNTIFSLDTAGNAVFAGALTASSIDAKKISGMEIFTDSLSALQGKVGELATSTIKAVDLSVLHSFVADGTMTINGTALFKDSVVFEKDITARKIVADELVVPGITLLSDSITALASSTASTTASLASRILALEDRTPLDLASLVTFDGGLTSNGITVLKGGLTVENIGGLAGSINLLDDVNFIGRPYVNADTAGFAHIAKGVRKVDVVFDREYLDQPVVSATISLGDTASDADVESILAENIAVVITKKSTKGFTIVLGKDAPADITLSWIALAVKNAKTFQSESTPVPPPTFQEVIQPPVTPVTEPASTTEPVVDPVTIEEVSTTTPEVQVQEDAGVVPAEETEVPPAEAPVE